MRLSLGFMLVVVGNGWVLAQEAPVTFHAPPGSVVTSWVGNSFGGDGGPNGFGYWVQNAAARAVVAPDGTVIAGIDWDEAGRCVGLYKDGRVNHILLKAEGEKVPDSAWGWGTGNDGAVAVLGEQIFVGTKGKKLLRFRWSPGDLDSAQFLEATDLPSEPVALSARGDTLAVAYGDRIALHGLADLKPRSSFAARDVRDVAFSLKGGLWVILGGEVRHISSDGRDMGALLSGLGKPTALTFGHHDELLYVCDDGPRQQVLVYDVAGEKPREVKAIGVAGGLYTPPAGKPAPDKFFSLRGAGTDRAGNLYVAMSFSKGPNGSLTLRSLSPDGALRWELQNFAFVDTFGFDPASDGAIAYGRLGIFDLDLEQTRPGAEWSLRGVSLDHLAHADDPRLKNPACSTIVRRPGGRRVLYTIGQYGGGYDLFSFHEPDGLVASAVDKIHVNDTWAWDVDGDASIWHGDAPGHTIRRYEFVRWEGDRPVYNWEKPTSWPWPEDFELVRRIVYDPTSDSLYLFGYLKGQAIDSWGVVGRTARRYDGWCAGKRTPRWTLPLPMTPDGEGPGKPLSAESVSVVGDYLLVGMCKPQDGRQYLHIFRLSDAGYVGSFWPGDAVGGMAGWLDMPYAMAGIKRKDGEYLLLVEEDFRGKNLLYRWKP